MSRQTDDQSDGCELGTVCASTQDDLNCPSGDGGGDDGDFKDEGGTPIILDLGSETYRLTSASAGVSFDLRNEGVRRQISWTRAGIENAFLALDRNGNGWIDHGAELFGDATPLASGERAPHGFAALRELDDNDDGTVDAKDDAWASLLLWTDRNHDGFSTADELQPMATSVVTRLNIGYQVIGRKDQWRNQFRYMARFSLRRDTVEQERTYYDVILRVAN